MLYNPYRNYDKGMDDAYMGYEPQATRDNQYMTGYEYAQYLLNSEQNVQECDATKMLVAQKLGFQLYSKIILCDTSLYFLLPPVYIFLVQQEKRCRLNNTL